MRIFGVTCVNTRNKGIYGVVEYGIAQTAAHKTERFIVRIGTFFAEGSSKSPNLSRNENKVDETVKGISGNGMQFMSFPDITFASNLGAFSRRKEPQIFQKVP
jgi:hypothetical protein